MPYITANESIDTAVTFVDAYNNVHAAAPAGPGADFAAVRHECISLVTNFAGTNHLPVPGISAFSNAAGSWYQWWFSLAWRHFASAHPVSNLLLRVPGKATLIWYQLYDPQTAALIHSLNTLAAAAGISLETSNPDYVAIRTGNLPSTMPPLGAISPATLTTIDNAYQAVVGTVPFANLPYVLSIKTSLRPDRRIQLQFEATMIKALQAYVNTRTWTQTPRSRCLAVVAKPATPADVLSLKCLAAHSLVTPLVPMEVAIDEVWTVRTQAEAFALFAAL